MSMQQISNTSPSQALAQTSPLRLALEGEGIFDIQAFEIILP